MVSGTHLPEPYFQIKNIDTGQSQVLIKRLQPVQTHLDYAESRVISSAKSNGKYRFLDKGKTQKAMDAISVTADDFNMIFEDRQDIALIHDLRISMPEGKLHIDHLFVTNNFHVFIVESRTAESSITLKANQSFTSTDEHAEVCAIPSPIEQLKRNRVTLKRVFRYLELPVRFGRELTPTFHHFVLFDADAVFLNQLGKGDEYFLSPQQLLTVIEQHVQKKSLFSFLERMPGPTLNRIARQLVKMHMPKEIRFSDKFRHVVIPASDTGLSPHPASSV